MDLFNTAPTTQAGIIAAFRYMRIQHGNAGEHVIQGWLEDEDGERYVDWRDAWLETLIEAVDALKPGGGNRQSLPAWISPLPSPSQSE